MINNIDEFENDDIQDENVVIIPINGILDLHTFDPKQLKHLLDDYIEACLEKSILDIRIIHGKGTGTLKKKVWSLLLKHPCVQRVEQAPLEAGSWGATLARLKHPV